MDEEQTALENLPEAFQEGEKGDTMQEAMMRKAEDGHVGVVVEQPGQVTACRYCPAFSVCSQKDALVASGDLQL